MHRACNSIKPFLSSACLRLKFLHTFLAQVTKLCSIYLSVLFIHRLQKRTFDSIAGRYKTQVTGHRSQVTGHRSQVTGHRLQVTGHRSQKMQQKVRHSAGLFMFIYLFHFWLRHNQA